MAMSTAPIVLNNVSLTLTKVRNPDGTPAVGGTATEYRCQLGKAQITPATGGGSTQTYDTFCETHTSQSGGATFSLDLGGFQAYTDVADLTVLLWNEAGAVYEFVLVPNGGTVSATNYGAQGEVTIVEAAIGGTAKQYPTFEVSLPCTAKPDLITAPPTARAAEAPQDVSEPVDESEMVAA